MLMWIFLYIHNENLAQKSPDLEVLFFFLSSVLLKLSAQIPFH